MGNKAEYLREMLEKYDMSQSELGRALGIPPKTISRYCNGDDEYYDDRNKGRGKYWQRIENYFDIKSGKWIDEYGIWHDEDEYDEPDEYEDLYLPFPNAGADGEILDKFTVDVQKYIVDNFDAFWYMSEQELLFLELIHSLSDTDKKQFVNELQCFPTTIEMIKANGRSSGKIICVSVIDLAMTNTFKRIKLRSREYKRMIRCYQNYTDAYLANEATQSDPEKTEEYKNQFNQLVYDRFYDSAIPIEIPSEDEFSEGYNSITYKYFDWKDRDFAGTLEKMLNFTEKDWYYLYLLTRIQIADYGRADASYSDHYKSEDGYMIRDKEYEIWKKLEELSNYTREWKLV